MLRNRVGSVVPAIAGLLAASPSRSSAGEPWASAVIAYAEGSGVAQGYNQPSAALGEPTRFTGVGAFPGAVTPFNPPFLGKEVVSIGVGGSLTMRFGHPVVDDPLNPFGIDLLVFGNAGYIDTGYPAGIAGPLFGAGKGTVEVSLDGVSWVLVAGAAADGPLPTLGYLDLPSPYATNPGTLFSDFTRPVDPAFEPTGLAFAQIVSAYAGSGGGTGIDLASTGLSAITHVRITNPHASGTVEVDAVADVTPVPEPASAVVLAVVAVARRRSRRRGGGASGPPGRPSAVGVAPWPH